MNAVFVFAVLSVLKSVLPAAGQDLVADWAQGASACPGFLISVIFATRFLGTRRTAGVII